MVSRFLARIGTLGVVAIAAAALFIGLLGGGAIEHVRLAAQQDQQQGEQQGPQSESQAGEKAGSKSESKQEGDNKTESQQDQKD